MNRILFLSVFLITSLTYGQTLDSYIQIALDSNLALQQKEYSYQKSLEALKEAKSMFLPKLSFNASYTMAEGGRTIQLPIPGLEENEFSFVRSTEQETKLVAQMPLFNAAIIQNHKIKRSFTDVESMNIDIYKRELVKEVKSAYIRVLQAEQTHSLYNNTLTLVKQSLTNRESLYKNNKITIDEVYAAKAQIKQVERDLTEADKNRKVAIAWFNFLLNRKLDIPVNTEQELTTPFSTFSLESTQNTSLSRREEVKQLEKYIEIQENNVKLERGSSLPTVSLFGQYGFQGTEYTFDSESDLSMVGVSLKWDLFTSGQRKAKVNQAQIERDITVSKKQEVERQIQLEIINAYYSIETAQKGIEFAQEELQNYEQSYRLVDKKYQQGMVNYLTYSYALNNKLNAENKLILAQYNYWLEQINLERLTASYQF